MAFALYMKLFVPLYGEVLQKVWIAIVETLVHLYLVHF